MPSSHSPSYPPLSARSVHHQRKEEEDGEEWGRRCLPSEQLKEEEGGSSRAAPGSGSSGSGRSSNSSRLQMVEFFANFRWLLHYVVHRLPEKGRRRYPTLLERVSALHQSLCYALSETIEMREEEEKPLTSSSLLSPAILPWEKSRRTAFKKRGRGGDHRHQKTAPHHHSPDEDVWRVEATTRLMSEGFLYLLVAEDLFSTRDGGACLTAPPTLHPFLSRVIADSDVVVKRAVLKGGEGATPPGYPQSFVLLLRWLVQENVLTEWDVANVDQDTLRVWKERRVNGRSGSRGASPAVRAVVSWSSPLDKAESSRRRQHQKEEEDYSYSGSAHSTMHFLRTYSPGSCASTPEWCGGEETSGSREPTRSILRVSGGDEPCLLRVMDYHRVAERFATIPRTACESASHLWGHLLVTQHLVLEEACRLVSVEDVERHIARLRRSSKGPQDSIFIFNEVKEAGADDTDTDIETILLEWVKTVATLEERYQQCLVHNDEKSARGERRHRHHYTEDTEGKNQRRGSGVAGEEEESIHSPYMRLLAACKADLDKAMDLYEGVRSGLALCVVLHFYLPEIVDNAYSACSWASSGWWKHVLYYSAEMLQVCTPFSASEALQYADSALSLQVFVLVQHLFKALSSMAETDFDAWRARGERRGGGGLLRFLNCNAADVLYDNSNGKKPRYKLAQRQQRNAMNVMDDDAYDTAAEGRRSKKKEEERTLTRVTPVPALLSRRRLEEWRSGKTTGTQGSGTFSSTPTLTNETKETIDVISTRFLKSRQADDTEDREEKKINNNNSSSHTEYTGVEYSRDIDAEEERRSFTFYSSPSDWLHQGSELREAVPLKPMASRRRCEGSADDSSYFSFTSTSLPHPSGGGMTASRSVATTSRQRGGMESLSIGRPSTQTAGSRTTTGHGGKPFAYEDEQGYEDRRSATTTPSPSVPRPPPAAATATALTGGLRASSSVLLFSTPRHDLRPSPSVDHNKVPPFGTVSFSSRPPSASPTRVTAAAAGGGGEEGFYSVPRSETRTTDDSDSVTNSLVKSPPAVMPTAYPSFHAPPPGRTMTVITAQRKDLSGAAPAGESTTRGPLFPHSTSPTRRPREVVKSFPVPYAEEGGSLHSKIIKESVFLEEDWYSYSSSSSSSSSDSASSTPHVLLTQKTMRKQGNRNDVNEENSGRNTLKTATSLVSTPPPPPLSHETSAEYYYSRYAARKASNQTTSGENGEWDHPMPPTTTMTTTGASSSRRQVPLEVEVDMTTCWTATDDKKKEEEKGQQQTPPPPAGQRAPGRDNIGPVSSASPRPRLSPSPSPSLAVGGALPSPSASPSATPSHDTLMLLQLLQQQQERMTALERELERLREERAGSKEHALALSVSALVGDDSEDSSAQSSRMVSSRPRRHYTASVIDQLYRDLSHRMGVEAGDHKGSLSHSCMTLDATSCFSDLGILIPRHDDDDDDEVAEEERVGAALPRSSSDAYVAVSSAGHQHTAGEATSGLAVSEHKTTTRRTHFSRGGGGAKEGQNGSSHHRHRRRRRHRDPEGQQASTSPTSLLSSLRTSTMYDVMAVTAPPQRGAAPHATTTMEESSSTVVDLTTII